MSIETQNITITYVIDEIHNQTPNTNIDELLSQIEKTQIKNKIGDRLTNYSENYTVKELLIICDYYGFAKELKSNKSNKETIVHFLLEFEQNINNFEIVNRRQNMWFYANELKNDKFMKKYMLL